MSTQEIMQRYGCSEDWASEIEYLRTRDDYTPELEAQFVAERRLGSNVSVFDWPSPDFETFSQRVRNLVNVLAENGKPETADRLLRLIEPLLHVAVLTVGDRVNYIGDDIVNMGEHFIMEAHFQPDGTVEYVTDRTAWLSRSDFELLERSNANTLAQLPKLLNRRERNDED